MTYGTFVLIVIGAGTVAGSASWTIRRSVPLEALRRHHEIGGAVFLQLGVVFAVLLAFVFNEVWNEYNIAAEAINRECASLHGAAILADGLRSPERESVEQSIRAYLAQVVEVEWPRMGQRGSSPSTSDAFRSIWRRVESLPADDAQTQSVRATIMPLLAQAHQQRETRMFQMTQGLPKLLWVLLVTFATILTGFLLAFGIDYISSQVLFVFIFAAVLAMVLTTVRLLDYPFEGALRLSPTDFQQTLQKVDRLILTGQNPH